MMKKVKIALSSSSRSGGSHQLARCAGISDLTLMQMAGRTEIFSIDMDTLSIEQDGIPDSERSGIFKPAKPSACASGEIGYASGIERETH
jgi:hypothetical protein